MSNDDVHGDDMAHPQLSDEQLAALLDSNSDDPTSHPVAEAILRARQQLGSEPVPTPGAALSEFLGVGNATDPMPQSVLGGDFEDEIVLEIAPAADSPPRRIPVLTSLSAFIGTLTGKLLVGATIAAASVGGAHASGVVDVPGLPEIDQPSITETLDDDRDESDTDDADSDDADLSNDDESDDSASTATSVAPTSTTVPSAASTAPTTSTLPTSSTVPSSSTSTTVPTTTVTALGSLTKAYSVAGVGTTTVVVANAQISLVSAIPDNGWSLDEAGPDANGVESAYVMGELETRIDFEIEDGQLRVRVRTRNDATDERTGRFEYFPL
jgi:hypothetical protein